MAFAAVLALLAALLASSSSPASAAIAATRRVSIKSNGDQVNSDNEYGSLSGTGRFATFESDGRFTPGDDGVDSDVFVHDRRTGKTTRVSVKANGGEVPGANSAESSISSDGRYVAFVSDGAFIKGDTNGYVDVYVKDRSSGRVRRASLSTKNQQVFADAVNPSISAKGRYVCFQSDGAFAPGDSNGLTDVYVRDLEANKTARASVRSDGTETAGDATACSVANDGRVAFQSNDQQMTPDADYGFLVDYDIFVRDTKAHATIRASLKADGSEADPTGNQNNTSPVISASGRYVAFIADPYGAFVPADTNNQSDVYEKDLKAKKLRRASVKTNGQQSSAGLGGLSERPLAISADGSRVAFETSDALVSADSNSERDVYMHDFGTGKTTRASVKSTGGQFTTGAGGQQLPAISADGHWVAFQTIAKPTGTHFDVFERGPLG